MIDIYLNKKSLKIPHSKDIPILSSLKIDDCAIKINLSIIFKKLKY